ncbi:ABC transporter permease [Spiroplasma sp. DGKH1]|uniref:ABC transporter permease n=1 Tax=Spiroplasma sp. DGKH1 TaxID=3050074 RepID=UPI0034C611A3
MKNNVPHNPHLQRSQSQLPPRQRAFWAIISFAIFKVTKSITIWVLMLLAVLLFNAFLVTLLIISPTYSNFIVNFQYEVIIFSNIFLLIFILLGAIKVYGRELQDGTYLLLISKPYHRLTIFFLKLLALWICLAFFIGLILLTGYLSSLVVYHFSLKPIFYYQILKLLVNLLKYTMMLSFLAVNGIICALSIFSSQIVILIVTIFCSLFLLGGLPYSLISTLSNNIEITFTNGGGTYPVSRLRETILFVEDLQDNQIAYPVLTKKIYDFYAQDSPSDLQAIINGTDSNLLKKNRLLFYQSLGLTKKMRLLFMPTKLHHG